MVFYEELLFIVTCDHIPAMRMCSQCISYFT